ncbi:CRTAC1 family protein [uncultured Paraglaciecola sp.]|jgi:hypothetical protein|uniref:CRTAC1 family protein n=1 Tax=uncultured Paraglaciecola sp. TaxID=1765024 RepID=UPI002612D3D4|nr:CRTAC1 family protein [uncultured Paraglaciecola sp.]
MEHTLRLAITLIVTSNLTGCGGGGGSSQSQSVTLPVPVAIVVVQPVNCDNINESSSAAFSDVSRSAGLCYTPSSSNIDSPTSRMAGGIAVSDYNGDGLLDFYVSHGRDGHGRLFRQTSDHRFVELTEQAGIASTSISRGAAFMDINLDGWPDLISTQDGPNWLQIFANNGDGSFTDITQSTGINLTKPAFSVAAGDYDLDGDLDLFFAHWLTNNTDNPLEYLWQNQGDSSFIDDSQTLEIRTIKGTFLAENRAAEMEYSFTPIFADINNDRYPDMLLTGDFNSSQILVNNNGVGFVDMTTDVFTDKAGMGAAVADYDNDGDLDWFVSAIGDPIANNVEFAAYSGNRLYQNQGMGDFIDATNEAGVRQAYWGWGSCFADFNNDGYQDLFVVNGYDGLSEEDSARGIYTIFNDNPAVLYINNGDNTFTERATELGAVHTQMGRGLACFDYDRDGDQDMFIANSGAAPTILRNNHFAQGQHFLNIRLQGLATNPQAVGARVYITVVDEERMIELQLGNNYLSQNPVEAHFGVGSAQQIESVRIEWPGLGGDITEMENVAVDQFLVIPHPDR